MVSIMNQAINFIEEKKHEIISSLQELIRAKTENPPGRTIEGIEVIARILKKYDIEYRIIEPSPEKQNLIAEIGNGRPVLILNGHVDVVPAGNGWSVNPYGGVIKGDKIYGRGATDMKSGVIAILYAFLAHRKLEKGKLVLTIVADEETGGKDGTEFLLKNGFVKGDACLIAEPSGRLNPYVYDIVAGEKGALWVRIKSKGKAAHGSLPMLGDNAIRKIASLINNLPILIPVKVKIPEDAKTLIEGGKKSLERVHKDAPKALDNITVNIGTIRGGRKTNMVPDECEITLDLRIPIGVNTEYALKALEDTVKNLGEDKFEIEIISRIEPSYTSPSNNLVKIVREVAKKYLGYEPLPICMAATSDARIFRHHGIPTINFGPGYLEKAHTRDEFILIQDVINFTKMYVEIINKFLGLS